MVEQGEKEISVDGEQEESEEEDATSKGEIGTAGAEEIDHERMCMPCEDTAADVDENGDEVETQPQRIATGPAQPTTTEIEEHELNGHAQFRSWCRACVLGRAKDTPSSRVKGLFAESVLPRVRMDYCFLTE